MTNFSLMRLTMTITSTMQPATTTSNVHNNTVLRPLPLVHGGRRTPKLNAIIRAGESQSSVQILRNLQLEAVPVPSCLALHPQSGDENYSFRHKLNIDGGAAHSTCLDIWPARRLYRHEVTTESSQLETKHVTKFVLKRTISFFASMNFTFCTHPCLAFPSPTSARNSKCHHRMGSWGSTGRSRKHRMDSLLLPCYLLLLSK